MDSNQLLYENIEKEVFIDSFEKINSLLSYLKGVLDKFGVTIILKSDNKVVMEDFLGKGSFGKAYRAKFGDEDVAIKFIEEFEYMEFCDKNIKSLLKGLNSMLRVTHERIPKFYGVYLDLEGNKLGLVLKFIPGITLSEFAHGKSWGKTDKDGDKVIDADHKQPSNQAICKHLIQYAEIIKSIHSQNNIGITNLSPKNVKITPEGELYLMDYGMERFSRIISFDSVVNFSDCGDVYNPVLYTPPEDIKRDNGEDYTDFVSKYDTWSLGIIILFLSGNFFHGLSLENSSKIIIPKLQVSYFVTKSV